MHRCLVNPDDWTGDRIALTDSEAHHLLRVVRAKGGDTVAVFDGRGRDALARVEHDAHGAVVLRVINASDVVRSGIDLTIIQAVPKGRRMELIIEKGTELGVRTFVPVLTARGIVRPDATGGDIRIQRWQRIAVSAARQCGVGVVPSVRPWRSLAEALDEETGVGLFLVGSLRDDARPLREVLAEAKAGKPERVTFLIGPEGDLTDTELDTAVQYGAVPVSFGPLIFRVETAALYAASVIGYEFSTG